MIKKDMSLFKRIVLNIIPILLSLLLIIMFSNNYKALILILDLFYGIWINFNLIQNRFDKIGMSLGIIRRDISYKYIKTEVILLVSSIVYNVLNILFALLVYKNNLFLDYTYIENIICIILYSLIIANFILLLVNIFQNKLTFLVFLLTSIIFLMILIYLYIENYIYLDLILLIILNIFITLLNKRIILKQNI